MNNWVCLDFETKSDVDLRVVGAWCYAESPSTSIICVGYSVNGEEPENQQDFDPGHGRLRELASDPSVNGDEPSNETVFEPGVRSRLRELAGDPEVIFVAHNAGFEKAVWRAILVKKFGWPDIPNERWHDTQAVAAIRALPLKLEKVGQYLGLKMQKDPAGKALLKNPTPENLPRIYEYCNQDVRTEKELLFRLGGYHEERENYLLDQRINERGVALDTAYIRRCLDLVEIASKPLAAEFRSLTGLNSTQTEAFKEWLAERGLPLESLNKDDLDELPDFCVPDSCARPLALRRVLGGATVRKFRAMLGCLASDGRAHGSLQYHGATTGRWSGRLYQPQNFPRDTLEGGEAFVQAVIQGDIGLIQGLWGDPFDALRMGARLAVMATPGNLMTSGDYAQIEARIVLAYAGQHDFLDRLAGGEDPYCIMAEYQHGRKIDKGIAKNRSHPEYQFHFDARQDGKATFLGAGFQMGWETYLERYMKPGDGEKAKLAIETYRKKAAPKVPGFWKALEAAGTAAVSDPGRAVETHGVEYLVEGDWLTCRLPSKRRLWYPFPKLERITTPWGQKKQTWSCSVWKNQQHRRRTSYGGLAAENVTQGLARDVMIHGMKNCEKAGLPVVLTVHDSIIADHDERLDGKKLLGQCMSDRPDWAIAMKLPIGAEIKSGTRYA